METATVGAGAMTMTAALAVLVESAALVAVTVTEPPEGTLAGAVYSPLVEIVPTVELPPSIPFTFQVTAVFVVPLTVAENCWVPLTCNAALVGLKETEMGDEETPVPLSEIEAFAAAVPLTVIVPEVLPWTLGLNATLSCKFPDGERVVCPFHPETIKAELLTLTDCRVTVRLLVLVSVTVCQELVVPTVWLPYERAVGLDESRLVPAAQAGIANKTVETRTRETKTALGETLETWNRE
jgi:hypothetical protein